MASDILSITLVASDTWPTYYLLAWPSPSWPPRLLPYHPGHLHPGLLGLPACYHFGQLHPGLPGLHAYLPDPRLHILVYLQSHPACLSEHSGPVTYLAELPGQVTYLSEDYADSFYSCSPPVRPLLAPWNCCRFHHIPAVNTAFRRPIWLLSDHTSSFLNNDGSGV